MSASSTARAERKAIDEMIQLLAIRTAGTDDPGRLAVRRQPAEGGDRQMADGQRRASSCSTIRPAASTSAPSRRSTSSCASSPTSGAAILFYSTDYDELIGCCDRVLVLYDGGDPPDLVGAEITERALDQQRAQHRRRRPREAGARPAVRRMRDWRYRFAEQRGTLLALAVFVADVRHLCRATIRPASPPMSCTTAANKGVLLALVAMAQTLVVLTAGIDLSVGMIFVLTNCLASWIVVGTPLTTTLGVIRRAAAPGWPAARSTA